MVNVQMKSRTDESGALNLCVDTGTSACEVNVTVLVERAPVRDGTEWPEFVRRVFGSTDDPTFERAPQGEYVHREA
jgi:hypothetical protein